MTKTTKTTLLTAAAAVAVAATISITVYAQSFRDRGNGNNSDRRDRSGFDRSGFNRDRDRNSRNGNGSQSSSSSSGSPSTNSSASASTNPSARFPDYRERYAILAERNIFLKERRRQGSERGPFDDRPREPRPEQTFALTGIVEEEGQFRAYFENLRNPSFTRVSLGDPIARGKVTAIALDAVEYEQDGQRRWIEIGHDLTGTRSIAPSSSTYTSSTSTSTTGPTTAPTLDFDPNDPALTQEQKMKARRMKEQGLIK
jgi:hypothetical protein